MRYLGFEVEVVLGEYSNHRTALQLIDKEDYSPVAVATVNLPEEDLGKNEVFIKNWSENTGMLEWLEEQGLVEKFRGFVTSGFIVVPKVKLNTIKLKEGADF